MQLTQNTNLMGYPVVFAPLPPPSSPAPRAQQ